MEKKKSNVKKKNNKKVVNKEVKNKEKFNLGSWFVKNLVSIICAVVGLGIGILVMFLAWPERIAKLSDGTEPVVSIDNLTITANDLYDKLKGTNGLAAILDMLDKNLLEQEYSDKVMEEASEYGKDTAAGYIENYQNYGYSKEDFLAQNGFKDEEEFVEYLKYDFLRNKWYADYLKTLITDKDIKKFYEKEGFGTREVVLISSSESDKDLKAILKDLKAGKTIDEIRKDYTDVVYNDATVTMSDIPTYSEAMLKKIKSLGKNKYSDIMKDDSYGNVIIYVTEAKELGKMEDIIDDLIKAISSKMDASDSKLYYKSFEVLREKYNIKFSDTAIEGAYKEYLKQVK